MYLISKIIFFVNQFIYFIFLREILDLEKQAIDKHLLNPEN